jgi:hypothetical protein
MHQGVGSELFSCFFSLPGLSFPEVCPQDF